MKYNFPVSTFGKILASQGFILRNVGENDYGKNQFIKLSGSYFLDPITTKDLEFYKKDAVIRFICTSDFQGKRFNAVSDEGLLYWIGSEVEVVLPKD